MKPETDCAPAFCATVLFEPIVNEGSSLTAVISIFTVPRETSVPPPAPVLPPSLAVKVRVAALFPLVFDVPVYLMFEAVLR